MPNRRREQDLKRRLDDLLAGWDVETHRRTDPVSFVHAAAPRDREVVGLLAATLAFGNVTAVRASVARALERLGPSASQAVDRLDESELRRRLSGFVHRVYRGDDVARMLAGAGRLRREHGTLGDAFAAELRDRDGDLREGLAAFADALRGPEPSRGLAHLVPDPRAGSACKRLLLYLRWMVRPADGVDLGLWDVDPALLLVPVDTHVHRISRNLGLTERRDASWRTAEEITDRLRRLDAADPVKYDFAICHMGVSRRCPSRRDAELCRECVLRPVCRAWRGDRSRSRDSG